MWLFPMHQDNMVRIFFIIYLLFPMHQDNMVHKECPSPK
jgi:hypothetical protein